MFESILNAKGSIYLASDLHLGAPDAVQSAIREKHFIHWMDEIKPNAAGLILLGDIFDFWFEYEHVIPKGFIRLQGKLAEWRDSGIPIFIFTGNHDLWMQDYFKCELEITVIHKPCNVILSGHHCHLAHGDGLGPGDQGFKIMKKLFTNPLARWAFKWLHPDLGVPLAQYFSGSSRKAHVNKDAIHYGENEYLYQYTRDMGTRLSTTQYFIFGHRHRPEKITMPNGQIMINLGDWIHHFSFAEIQADDIRLYRYTPDRQIIKI